MATVALTESMLIIVYAFAMGLAIGVGAIVARRIGERDPEGAARAPVQAIVLGVGLAVVVGVIGVAFGGRLLGAMGGSAAVVALGSRFTRVMLGGIAFRACDFRLPKAPRPMNGPVPAPPAGTRGSGWASPSGRGGHCRVAYELAHDRQ